MAEGRRNAVALLCWARGLLGGKGTENVPAQPLPFSFSTASETWRMHVNMRTMPRPLPLHQPARPRPPTRPAPRAHPQALCTSTRSELRSSQPP